VSVAVCADPSGDARLHQVAEALAQELGLPLVLCSKPGDATLLLVVRPERLELRVVRGELAGGRPIFVDLLAMDVQSPAGRRVRQPIARAVGLVARKEAGKPLPVVIDATAGFGEDAWLLASLGCRVIAIERSPIMAALLQDGLRRAASQMPDIAQRIELRIGNSIELLSRCEPVDVIYLDPMFPTGRKTLERKPMRVLRALVGADTDAEALLRAAQATGTHRVVVKRPLRSPPLGNLKPHVTHEGRALRFDVYVRNVECPMTKK